MAFKDHFTYGKIIFYIGFGTMFSFLLSSSGSATSKGIVSLICVGIMVFGLFVDTKLAEGIKNSSESDQSNFR